MDFPVNRPVQLSAAAGTLATVTVNVVPNPAFFYGAGVAPQQNLTLNNSATFAGASSGNAVWTAPVAALPLIVGRTVQMSVTLSNGLVVSAVPPGVGVTVSWS